MRTKHDWIVRLFVCPYNPKWSIDDAPDKYIMGTLCLLFVSKHVSVSPVFVRHVFRTFARWLSSLSNFITTRLGRMKAWAACNSLDWVTCFPLHFTLAYIVYRESQTRQVVNIHVQYGVMKCTLESTVVWLICHFFALFVLK